VHRKQEVDRAKRPEKGTQTKLALGIIVTDAVRRFFMWKKDRRIALMAWIFSLAGVVESFAAEGGHTLFFYSKSVRIPILMCTRLCYFEA